MATKRALSPAEKRLLLHIHKLTRRAKPGKALAVEQWAPILRDDLPAVQRLRGLGLVGIAIRAFPTDEGRAVAGGLVDPPVRRKTAPRIHEARPGHIVKSQKNEEPGERNTVFDKIERFGGVFVRRGAPAGQIESGPQAVHVLADPQPRDRNRPPTVVVTACGLDVSRLCTSFGHYSAGAEPWRRVNLKRATCATCAQQAPTGKAAKR